MKNKIILILLTVFVVGSIAGITALNSLQEDQKVDAVGKAKKNTLFAISAGSHSPYDGFLEGYLQDIDRKGLANKEVTVKSSDGKIRTCKTKSNGNFDAYPLPYGIVTITFAGDKDYNPCTLSYNNDGEDHKINWR